MSRTIKTRPLVVRMLDPKDHSVGVSELHRHDKGYCDLPARNIDAVLEREELLRSGEYEVPYSETCDYSFSYVGVEVCGCAMCTEQDERKAKARKTRRETKVELRKQTKSLYGANVTDEVWSGNVDELEPTPLS